MGDRPLKVARFWTYAPISHDLDESSGQLGAPVPFDIMYLVMQHLDRTDLKLFGLTNRDIHKQANKILWRSASIHTSRTRFSPGKTRKTKLTGVETPVSLDEQCDAIIRDQERATYIRSLYIGLGLASLSQPIPTAKIRHALQSACNLVTLRTSATFPSNIQSILNPHPPLPFHLKVFVNDDTSEQGIGLEPFFASQPTITTYTDERGWSYFPDKSMFAPSPLLPNLDTVWAEPRFIHRIIKLRAISSINIQYGAFQSGQLQDILTASSVPLTSLRMHQFCAGQSVFESLALIGKYAPHLRTLGVRHDLELVNRLEFLQGFRKLEELEWWMDIIHMSNSSHGIIVKFVQECLTLCPTLRRIVYIQRLASEGSAGIIIFEAPHPDWMPPDHSTSSTSLDLRALGWTMRTGLRKSVGRHTASEPSASSWGLGYEDTLSPRVKFGLNVT